MNEKQINGGTQITLSCDSDASHNELTITTLLIFFRSHFAQKNSTTMATKPSSSTTTTTASASAVAETSSVKISPEVDPKHVSETQLFVKLMGIGAPVPENCNTDGFFDSFLRNFIKVDQIQRGRITCTVVAKPPICVTSFSLFFHFLLNVINVMLLLLKSFCVLEKSY